MKYQPLQNITSILKKTPDIHEISAMLEFYEQPSILISAKTFEIVALNKEVLEFTKYSESELEHTNIDVFLPGISLVISDLKASSKINCSLVSHSGKYLPVVADVKILPPSRAWYLLFLIDPATSQNLTLGQTPIAYSTNLLEQLYEVSTQKTIKNIFRYSIPEINFLSSSLYIKMKKDNYEFTKYISSNSQDYPNFIINNYPEERFQGLKNSIRDLNIIEQNQKFEIVNLPNKNPEGFLIFSFPSSFEIDGDLESKLNYLAHLISIALKIDNYSHKIDYLSNRLKTNNHIDTDLINYLNDSIIFTDHRLNVINMNLAAEKLFGYSSSEVKNSNLSKIFNTDIQQIFDRLGERKESKDSVKLKSFPAFNRSGNDIPIDFTIIPNLTSKNLFDFAFLIKDVSEIQNLQGKLNKLEHQANLGDISSIFAHEVLNPVNNISTRLQLMLDDFEGDESKTDEITKMLSSCDRITQLMESVKEYSKQTGYKIESLDINKVLTDLINQRAPRLKQANIKLKLSLNNLPIVKGDKRALEQAFTNLISNSIRALKSQGGGVLGIKTLQAENKTQRKFVRIFLSDTGPGIPEEIQKDIFKPFFTTHRTGTGLGLALVKKTVSFHKGKISLESFPGGTIFKITLPAAK